MKEIIKCFNIDSKKCFLHQISILEWFLKVMLHWRLE